MNTQTDALVRHFIHNRDKASKNGFPEYYIYKLHHDGPNALVDPPNSKRSGLKLANESIIPKIADFERAIGNSFSVTIPFMIRT